jgi:hypothetical protein
MSLAAIFQNYGATISRDQLAERLRLALAPFTFNGTEVHNTINSELRGPESEIAASAIRHANVSRYQGTVPVDAVVETVLKFAENEDSSESTQFAHERE